MTSQFWDKPLGHSHFLGFDTTLIPVLSYDTTTQWHAYMVNPLLGFKTTFISVLDYDTTTQGHTYMVNPVLGFDITFISVLGHETIIQGNTYMVNPLFGFDTTFISALGFDTTFTFMFLIITPHSFWDTPLWLTLISFEIHLLVILNFLVMTPFLPFSSWFKHHARSYFFLSLYPLN